MTQYIVSITDDSKASHVFALLKDLAYVDISLQGESNSVITRKPSVFKGKIHLSDDFDAPLNDFKEYME
jgi:hypothetical protein